MNTLTPTAAKTSGIKVARNGFTDNTTGRYEVGTPQRLFDELNKEFHFTVDVCASKENAKCRRYYDKKTNGLNQNWTGETCWCNPPYGRVIAMWLKKARESHATVVCLVPSRTDNYWWHRWAMMADEIRFIRGRLRFNGAGDGAKFPSAILIYNHLPPKLTNIPRDVEEKEKILG